MANATASEIRNSRKILQNQFAHLGADGGYEALTSKSRKVDLLNSRISSMKKSRGCPYGYDEQIEGILGYKNSIETLLSERKKFIKRQDSTIETIVVNLQNTIWKNKDTFSDVTGVQISGAADITMPELGIKYLEYDYQTHEYMGQDMFGGQMVDVAGLIDHESKSVTIASKFPTTHRRFTAAHELGHLVLHEMTGLHRDKPLSGGGDTRYKDYKEYEADKFATYYLMPARFVKHEFERRFGMSKAEYTQEFLYAIGGFNFTIAEFHKRFPYTRDMAIFFATTPAFNGENFTSMMDRFGVSATAMARRLEEVDLFQKF